MAAQGRWAPILNQESELIGKTIQSVIKNHRELVFRFTDGSFASLLVEGVGEDAELDFQDDLSQWHARDFGLITQEQIWAELAIEQTKARERQREAEKARYLELKAKYEPETFNPTTE